MGSRPLKFLDLEIKAVQCIARPKDFLVSLVAKFDTSYGNDGGGKPHSEYPRDESREENLFVHCASPIHSITNI